MKVTFGLPDSHELGYGMGWVQSVVFPVVHDRWGGMNDHVENNTQPMTYIFRHNLIQLPSTTPFPLGELLTGVSVGVVDYCFEKRMGQK